MTAQPSEGWVHRAPRPLILWGGVALVVSCIAIAWALIGWFGPFMTAALERWSRGEHVDWAGFALMLGAIGTFLGTAWGIIAQVANQRHIERRDAISRGEAPTGPFSPSPPFSAPSIDPIPGGGLVNNQAIE